MRYFGIKENKPLNFLICGQLVSKNDFIHIRRTINENVFIFVLKGTLFINSNNKNYSISENQFIFLKAGEEHFGIKKTSGPLLYYWVHFSDNTILLSDNTNFSQYKYFFPETGTILDSSRLILLFRQLMDFSLEQNIYNKEILNYSLSIFIIEVSQKYIDSLNNKKEINPIINQICIWIKSNYQTNFSLQDLAEQTGYQQTYLSTLFRKNMNMSIIQYTNNLRILSSKNLLQNFSIKETAYSCGFEDEKYFMKVFKKQEGITPTQFKQAFSKKNINQ